MALIRSFLNTCVDGEKEKKSLTTAAEYVFLPS